MFSAQKALDKNIVAAACEGDCASVVHMVNYLGVPVDFQESPVSFQIKLAQMVKFLMRKCNK